MKFKYFICIFCLFLLTVPSRNSFPWLFDRGLENSIDEMKNLFKNKKLMKLYSEYVDRDLKRKVDETINKMKSDRNNSYKILIRLKFKSYESFQKADNNTIIKSFFSLMLNPPKKKLDKIENAEYLKLGLMLSLMFAHFDNGMEIYNKEISGSNARVYYHGNGLKIMVYYVYRDERWFISDGGFIK